MFTVNYDELPNNPILALGDLMHDAIKYINGLTETDDHVLEMSTIYGILCAYLEAADIKYPEIDNTVLTNNLFHEYNDFFRNVNIEIQKKIAQEKINEAQRLNGEIKLLEEEKEDIRNHITSLREKINSANLSPEIKNKLLKKLYLMERELNKKYSNHEIFFGFVIETSIVARKVHENLKPIIDDVKDILEIVTARKKEDEGLKQTDKLPYEGQDLLPGHSSSTDALIDAEVE